MEREFSDRAPGASSGHAAAHAGGAHTLDAEGAVLRFDQVFLGRSEADDLRDELMREVAWAQHEIRLFGRIVPCPRLSAWYGDPGAVYRYSGLTLSPSPWLPSLARIRDRVAMASGSTFNSVLLNLYRDGRDSMGWHADDEPELGEEPVIASVSLGATRRMRFRPRAGGNGGFAVDLTHGSLLVMAGPTQANWHHAIPKTSREVGSRINLTFRRIVSE